MGLVVAHIQYTLTFASVHSCWLKKKIGDADSKKIVKKHRYIFRNPKILKNVYEDVESKEIKKKYFEKKLTKITVG